MGAALETVQQWFTPPKSKSIWDAMWFGGKKTTPDNAGSPTPGQQDIGNLTEDEAQGAAAKRAYRANMYFTSPTGTLNTATRRGARLTGS